MTVEPTHFVSAMTEHWQTTLGNVASAELQDVWRQMASTFNRQIINHGTPEGDRWKVLQPATGTGKSQGLAVYCSLLSRNTLMKPNTGIEELDEGISALPHPGVLIVTRLIEQANEVAATINQLTGKMVAVAAHSGNRVPASELKTYPVVVITHAAYENGLDAVNRSSNEQRTARAVMSWETYHAWGDGVRKLTVIDEALDIIQEAQIDLDKVRRLRAFIPFEVAEAFPRQMEAIAHVEHLLTEMSRVAKERQANGYVERERVLWSGRVPMPVAFDMTELRKAINSLPLDRQLLGKEDAKENARLRTLCCGNLRDLQATMEQWNWYAKKMSEHTLNTARLIVPEGTSGAVILDATASSNLIYKLFDNRVDVIPVLTNARSYSNVTLHVSRGHAVGKSSMVENAKEQAPRLVSNLMESLGADRKVFVCCHHRVEPHLISLETGFAAFDAGHWGAIDGRNNWSEFDTAVIFGLPYRDKVWSANTFMAVRGLQDDNWLNADGQRPFKDYPDVRHALEVGQLVVSIVQAINRVRCRRVIDSAGNCPPTDVFILLPGDRTGQEVLDGITKEMPGINVVDWAYGEAKRKLRKSNHEEALLRFAGLMSIGRKSASDVCQHLGISRQHWDRMVTNMRNRASTLAERLSALGVYYLTEGKGRGARSYLVKN